VAKRPNGLSSLAKSELNCHRTTITGLEPVKRDLYLEMSELILTRNDRARRR
jgi:hypothetical protein